MDLLDGIRTFVAVAESGSFTAAAARLGITNKVASKYVAALEERLGHTLLYRTTRAVSLTDDGARWLPFARAAIDAVEAAQGALQEPGEGLTGRLRLACGTTLGELVVADTVRAFLAEHPGMRVEMVMSDGLTDLAAGGFDMAVRIGIPLDSSLRMQKVGETVLRVAASPAYLAQAGVPLHPADLAQGHRALLDLNEARPGRWGFETPEGPVTMTLPGSLVVNSAAITIRMALAGDGLVHAPDIFLAPHLAAGTLVEVLGDFAGPAHPIHLLTLPTAFRQHKTTAFAAVLRRRLAAL